MRTHSFLCFAVTSLVAGLCGWCGCLGQTPEDPARVDADLREAPRYIFHSRISLPVKPGPLTLVYPKWIPGDHSPVGPVVDLTGLKMWADGTEISWRRDDVDMFAFHLDVPSGAKRLEIKLDYLPPAEANGSPAPGTSKGTVSLGTQLRGSAPRTRDENALRART